MALLCEQLKEDKLCREFWGEEMTGNIYAFAFGINGWQFTQAGKLET